MIDRRVAREGGLPDISEQEKTGISIIRLNIK